MPKLLPILISLALPCAAQLRQDIEYSKPGGISLTLDAFTPPGPGPFPAVIIVHGGGWVNGTKTSYVPPLFDPLSKAGYAWFTINYRMAPAHHFPAPIEDLEAAIRWVKKNANTYKVDPRRIALMGESAGGQIAAYVAARGKGDTKVKAAVIFYGPHDLWDRAQKAHEVSANVKQYLAINGLEDEARLRAASPINYVHKGMPPFLLIHGTADAQVPFEQSPMMCAKMKEAGARCELFTVEGAPHGIGGWEKVPAHQTYKEKMVEWLQQTL